MKPARERPYAEADLEAGPERTMETAISLGLPERTPGLAADASNVLGSASPTVAEMAEVYGSTASGGVHRDSYVVQSVTRPDGSRGAAGPAHPGLRARSAERHGRPPGRRQDRHHRGARRRGGERRGRRAAHRGVRGRGAGRRGADAAGPPTGDGEQGAAGQGAAIGREGNRRG